MLLVGVFLVPPLWVELTPGRLPGAVPLPALAAADSGRRFAVYVADWGSHTAIIVEQPGGWRLGPDGREAQAASPFVEYAWGDRRFYMESRYAPWSVFATLFLPTEAVTYVDGWQTAPRAGGGMRALYHRQVGASEHRQLVAELERWIRRDRRGDRVPAYAPARGYAGRFFAAPGRYLWWTNCNRWTVERLQAAGLARGGRGVIFSGQVDGRLTGFRLVR